MAASSHSLIFSTKLEREMGICSNMDRKDNRTPQGDVKMENMKHEGAFERQRCMNVVVDKDRNPQLNEYIHSAVNGILPFISKGLVDRVPVIFFGVSDVPIERFIFKLNGNQSHNLKVEQAELEFLS